MAEKESNKNFQDRHGEYIPSIIIFLISLLSYPALMLLAGRSIYDTNFLSGLLFSPQLCMIFIIIAFVLTITFHFTGKKKLSDITYTVQVCAAGYFLMEIFYMFIHFTLPLPESSSWISAWIFNFNIYLFHRSHQYIALAFIIFILYRKGRTGTTLYKGNINFRSNFLGPEKIRSWKEIAIWLTELLIGFSILFLILRIKTGGVVFTELKNSIYTLLFIPLFLGALNHSFIEELLFRGIFLSRFKELMTEKKANYLQAILFGLFHTQFYDIISAMTAGGEAGKILIAVLIQIAILAVYTFVGWILGRSALETKGIAISTSIHTSIVIATYISKGLIY